MCVVLGCPSVVLSEVVDIGDFCAVLKVTVVDTSESKLCAPEIVFVAKDGAELHVAEGLLSKVQK